jgi:hypothetical protein
MVRTNERVGGRMTTEKAIEFGKIFLKTIADEKGSATYEFVEMAVKMMEQESTLDKIRAEIEQITDTMGVSYNQYVSKVDVFDIIDKYKAESEG